MTRRPGGRKIALCVITFLRPVGLERLLNGIAELEYDRAAVDLDVIVVDNDANGSGREVAERAAAELGPTVVYCVEPERGIPFARNRALAEAAGRGPEIIGWLDDDEVPAADWLSQVLDTMDSAGADVVIGPSVPEYEPGATEWIVDAGFFEPERFTTGEPFPFFHTRTSGVIMRAGVVPPQGFETRMTFTGGTDRLFFTRVHRAGGSFVWNDEAIMFEHVPASRVSSWWLLKRWYRIGVTRSLTLLYLDEPGLPRRLRRVAGGLLMAARGAGGTAMAVRRGKVGMLRASRLAMIGLGAAAGALGLRYGEYRTVHGT